MPTVHARTAIRDAIATLVTGLASTGSRVHKAYTYPKGKSALPCLLVRVGDEQVAPGTIDRAQERTLDIVITGMVLDRDDIDAQLNQIALEVETAIRAADPSLGGKVLDLWLESVRSDLDISLQEPCGRIDLIYQATYFTTAGVPGVIS
jgi:hypothetical protein